MRIYSVLLVLIGLDFSRSAVIAVFFDSRVEGIPHDPSALSASSFMLVLSLYCSRNFVWAQQLEEKLPRFSFP
jgi:hypothetical protein